MHRDLCAGAEEAARAAADCGAFFVAGMDGATADFEGRPYAFSLSALHEKKKRTGCRPSLACPMPRCPVGLCLPLDRKCTFFQNTDHRSAKRNNS